MAAVLVLIQASLFAGEQEQEVDTPSRRGCHDAYIICGLLSRLADSHAHERSGRFIHEPRGTVRATNVFYGLAACQI